MWPAATAVNVDLSLLQEENNALIHRITDMQQNKWRIEERVKDLEVHFSLCECVAGKQSKSFL